MPIPLIETNGQQTNFGPKFWEAKEELDKLFGKPCLPVSTGTSALQLCCQLAFHRNWRIAVPDFTMVATLQAVVAAGCKPLVVPCDEHSGIIKDKVLAELYKWGSIDGAVVVSPFGAAFDHTKFEALKIPLVYDLAGAFPMNIATQHPAAYSCHATKNISTREGGFLVLKNRADFETARRLSCFSLDDSRNPTTIWAGNHKMDEARCEMLLNALKYSRQEIYARISKKRRLVRFYTSQHSLPLHGLLEGFPSLCVMKVPDAQLLERHGAQNGVTFKRYYHPLLSDCQFQDKVRVFGPAHDDLRKFIAFPSDATDEQAEEVMKIVRECFR